ncbi:MAG: ATP synthase F1 subunit delta [Oscillospiraceae bacterium]|nr:ATP synthase F1 subunit delta [Oscillospiraceae bacterium]
MIGIGSVYGEALYTLARDEGLSETILQQLKVLDGCLKDQPEFIRLLGAPNLPKAERCQILDDSFRGQVNPYVLNFLKILTEKGYARHFSDCVKAYREFYNRDNGILPVTAVTAVTMTEKQTATLTEKLQQITGKRIELVAKLDPNVLGGIRLDYDGKRVDDTVAHRMDAVRNMLKNTVL